MPNTERVLQLILAKPGLKAKDMAAHLGISRKEVNSALHGPLRGKIVQDKSYRWWPRGSPNAQAIGPEVPKTLDTPLARLCRYYLECLTYDYTDGISVYASSRYGLDYVELENVPFIGEGAGDLFEEENARRLLGKVGKERAQLALYLGYPVRLRKIRSRSGWEGLVAEPIFLFPFRFDHANRYAAPSLDDDLPVFNFKALGSLMAVDSGNAMDEAIQLSEELGLNAVGDDLPEIDEIFPRLRSTRPDWDWQEAPDPYHLSTAPPLSAIGEQGIYNRAILVVGERSPFTAGLETELAKLARLGEKDYESTALGGWVRGESVVSSPPEAQVLLEVLPLNTEQRQAVLNGFSNDLTVVTGPPGTGKSQVVTSLLVNAAWQGKKVLFASKNNMAVTVVEARVNALGPRPVLLRLGRNEYQTWLAEYLVSLLAATASSDDAVNYEHCLRLHEKLRQHSEGLETELQNVITLRNNVDCLEQALEPMRAQLGDVLVQHLRRCSPQEIRAEARRFSTALRGAIRERQPVLARLFWRLLKNSRYSRLAAEATRLAEGAESLGLSLPDDFVDDDTISAWESFGGILDTRLTAAEQVKMYFDGLKALESARPPEAISLERNRLVRDLTGNSEELWGHWLRLQPSRMAPEERRLLSEYCSLLQMIVAGSEDKQSLGKEVFARYYRLFPRITGILSCWAVTSLTARRIPFEPGFFDLVVIDEASQCDIASALPLLYRAKHAVIIGDPMQLKHISALNVKQDRQLLAKHGLVEGLATWAYSVNSLFDLARSLCRSEDIISLRDHHRSHADIISFSNDHFYEGRLRVATRYDRLKPPSDGVPAVRWIDVKGRVHRPSSGGAVNEQEAKAVVGEIRRLVLQQGYRGTIGVVSPFRAHANLVTDLVHQDDDLSQRLWSMDFLADTVHRFQGDERDLMIFSPVVSSGVTDTAIGFLKTNSNLFNVAITRARAALVVVGDMQAARNSGVEYLASFADHVANIGRDRQTPSVHVSDLGPRYPPVAHPERVSDWERLFYGALYAAGLRPIPQRDEEQYALDLALFQGNRKLDIEVDGEHYHRNWDGELCRRDQIRNQRLMELGWDVMRFWVYQIRDDLPVCVERVKRWASQAADQPLGSGQLPG